MIGTPAYNSVAHIDYIKSLISIVSNQIPFTMIALGNESLITRGRNNIFSQFVHMKEFDHLLFLDADIYIDGADVKKLLNSGKDVIGAAVRLKSQAPIYNFNPGPQMKMEDNYVLCEKLGTAVFMLSRKAAETLAEDARKDGRVYDSKSILGGGDHVEFPEYYDVFRVGVDRKMDLEGVESHGIYLSEDYYACHKLRQLGFKVYMDPTIKTIHHGMLAFEGAGA